MMSRGSFGRNYSRPGAQSDSDFITKFQIALKKGKESLFWLRLLRHARPDCSARIDALLCEPNEIVSILIVSLRTAKPNARNAAEVPSTVPIAMPYELMYR
jgi:hypothetical protein